MWTLSLKILTMSWAQNLGCLGLCKSGAAKAAVIKDPALVPANMSNKSVKWTFYIRMFDVLL